MNNKAIKIGVLGMGNILLKDEGIGVHVIRALQGTTSSVGVTLEIVDGGTLPGAPFALDGADKLIIIDAVKAGGEPGTIYRFRPEDIKSDSRLVTSLHQISLLQDLWLLAHSQQKPPEVVIIGIEPADMDIGLELSTGLRERVPQIVNVVMSEVNSACSLQSEKGVAK